MTNPKHSSIIKRTVFTTTIINGAVAPTFNALQFKLNDLPSYTEFTNLFEEYRITHIKVMFIPKWMTNNVMQNVNIYNPFFVYSIDKDDANVPASFNELWQRANAVTRDSLTKFSVSFKPHSASYQYTGAASGYSPSTGFINCDYPAVLYYGLKFGIEQSSAAQYIGYNIITTYTVQFRGVR